MVEAVLHLLKIHRKVVFGNPAIIVQNMFGKTPKSFNPVDMILAAIGKGLAVVQPMVFAQPLQGIVASESVGVVDRALSGFLPDNRHKVFLGHMLHYARIDLAIALQKAKCNVFAGCTPPALAFASAAEIALVHLHFAVQRAALQLRHMINRFSEFLIHACNRLVVEAEVMGETVCRLLLVEALRNGNFRANPFQRFLFSTGLVAAPDVSAARPRNLERTAENALSTPQKVGRTTENVLFPLYHMDILSPYGYETP